MQGGSETYANLRRPRHDPPRGQRASRARHVNGHHRRPAHHRQHPRPGLPFPEPPLDAARALGEDQERPAVAEEAEPGLERAAVRAVPLDGARVQPADEPSQHRDPEQLLLRQQAKVMTPLAAALRVRSDSLTAATLAETFLSLARHSALRPIRVANEDPSGLSCRGRSLEDHRSS